MSLFDNATAVSKNETRSPLFAKEGGGGVSLGGLAMSIGSAMIGSAVSGKVASSKALSTARAAMNDPGSFILDKLRPGMGNALSQERFWNSNNPLFGGITPKQAKQIYDAAQADPRARKNLWLLQVHSELAGYEDRFNLFATEVEYSPYNVSGEKRHVGMATVDAVTGNEPVEMRITTLDDMDGNLKRWFAAHSRAVSAKDGTVGVPADYAVMIHVIHGRVVRDTDGYWTGGLFRPTGIDLSLSRREDGLQELQMTFTQLDSFLT